jgi:glycosyltransferase involved in cell wall biosynthesis
MQRTVREKRCKFMATIHPLHTALPEHNMPFDPLTRRVDKVFSICGPYWYDSIEQSPFAHWKPKITRLDMAVDGEQFPYLRQKFNPVGRRKLLYIGSSMPMKNLGLLMNIMKRMHDVRLKWVGGDNSHKITKLPNVDVVGFKKFTPKVAQEITDECDIFVNVSNSDANPTTILESMAWGTIQACTKESGYWNDPLFTELHLHDMTKTVQNLRKLLTAPEADLIRRAKAGRKAIETKYTWDRFCNTIWREIEPYVPA